MDMKFIEYPTGADVTDKFKADDKGTICNLADMPINPDAMWQIGLGEVNNPQIVLTDICLVCLSQIIVGAMFWISQEVQRSSGLIEYMDGEYADKKYFIVQAPFYFGAEKNTNH